MRADLTRLPHRPGKHYSSVRMQQGRVQLDSDWNEQVEIGAHIGDTTRVDVIGPCGAPEADAGFEVAVTPDGADLTLSPGRIYVDGVLCELDTTPMLVAGSDGAKLLLEEIDSDEHELAAGDWVELSADGIAPTVAQLDGVDAGARALAFAAGGPDAAALAALAAAPHPQVRWVVTYLTQPDFPGPRPSKIELSDGGYLAYLDVWQQHVTALEDRMLRETALGGPDTATRTRTVWQLKLFAALGAAGGDREVSCDSEPDPASFPQLSSGRLSARAEPPTTSADPCDVPPGAGYRRVENQLYRVEIRDPGELGKATFVWSRENGSVVSSWLGNTSSTEIQVSSLGRDEVLGFAPGDLVELASDVEQLGGTPGALAQVTQAVDSTLKLSAAAPITPDESLHPEVRRWEGEQTTAAGWLTLEDGVEVSFQEGFYNTGDYWLVPARTATGDVEWPRDSAGTPVPRHADGIAHDYCKLAAMTLGGGQWQVVAICRPTFPPLTGIDGGPGKEPGIHVTMVRSAKGPLQNDTDLPLTAFARGIIVVADGAFEPGTILKKPTVLVTLDLPYPLAADDRALFGIEQAFGTIPVTLNGVVKVEGNELEWVPDSTVRLLIQNSRIFDALEKAAVKVERLLLHLTLKGNFIYGEGKPELDLDGELFGVLDGTTLGVKLPSGDGRRGGDLEMWFWLVRDSAPAGNSIVVAALAQAQVLANADQQREVPQIVGLVADRAKLQPEIPATYVFDPQGPAPDPAQARALADQVGLVGKTIRAAVEAPLGPAANLLSDAVAQVGFELVPVTMEAAAIVSLATAPAGQGFDLVIAGQDTVDNVAAANAEALPAEFQVQL